MSDFLSATVNSDGTVNTVATPDNTSVSTKGSSTLGKDAFLNLLVAQMKYQDPLNPTSDTEWIAQMATFSTLEEMQNMNTTMSNSQALSLVGKTVIINSDSTLTGGKVDYVVMQNGKAYLAVNGALYSIDDLDTVADEEYLEKLNDDSENTTESEEEEPSDTEKLLEAIEKLVGKMDTVGTTIDKAAESISDAVDSINKAAEDAENAGNSSGTEIEKEEEISKVMEKGDVSEETDASKELDEAENGVTETDGTDAAETEDGSVSDGETAE